MCGLSLVAVGAAQIVNSSNTSIIELVITSI
jgi:hypothetical protein